MQFPPGQPLSTARTALIQRQTDKATVLFLLHPSNPNTSHAISDFCTTAGENIKTLLKKYLNRHCLEVYTEISN